MEHVRIDDHGAVRVVTMRRGKANALNGAMTGALQSAIGEARGDEAVRGIVLASGCPRFFSSGFDVEEVFALGRTGMKDFFERFTALYESIALCPKPVVAAISGYAFAGGAVLAVACDFRVMAEGPWSFALNEVNLGTLLPDGIIRLVLGAVGPAHARAILLSGETIAPARAFEIGLAKELTGAEAALDRSVEIARSLAGKTPSAFAQVKGRLRECGGYAGSDPAAIEAFLDSWFSEEAIERRGALRASMNKT